MNNKQALNDQLKVFLRVIKNEINNLSSSLPIQQFQRNLTLLSSSHYTQFINNNSLGERCTAGSGAFPDSVFLYIE